VVAAVVDHDKGIDSLAVYNTDQTHRYVLYRVWSDVLPLVVIGLNPSTATERVNDATIRRCLRYARDWGHGGLVMLNLFSLRATDPQVLYRQVRSWVAQQDNVELASITGGDTHERLLLHYTEPQRQSRILVAWGNHGGLLGRSKYVLQTLAQRRRTFEALGVTKEGMPAHPLYQPVAARPQPYPVGSELVNRHAWAAGH
jgi:hypothetical protein